MEICSRKSKYINYQVIQKVRGGDTLPFAISPMASACKLRSVPIRKRPNPVKIVKHKKKIIIEVLKKSLFLILSMSIFFLRLSNTN